MQGRDWKKRVLRRIGLGERFGGFGGGLVRRLRRAGRTLFPLLLPCVAGRPGRLSCARSDSLRWAERPIPLILARGETRLVEVRARHSCAGYLSSPMDGPAAYPMLHSMLCAKRKSLRSSLASRIAVVNSGARRSCDYCFLSATDRFDVDVYQVLDPNCLDWAGRHKPVARGQDSPGSPLEHSCGGSKFIRRCGGEGRILFHWTVHTVSSVLKLALAFLGSSRRWEFERGRRFPAEFLLCCARCFFARADARRGIRVGSLRS